MADEGVFAGEVGGAAQGDEELAEAGVASGERDADAAVCERLGRHLAAQWR